MAPQITRLVYDGLLKRLFKGRPRKTSKLHVTGLLWKGQWPMNSPHKGPVMREMFPFDDVIIKHGDDCAELYVVYRCPYEIINCYMLILVIYYGLLYKRQVVFGDDIDTMVSYVLGKSPHCIKFDGVLDIVSFKTSFRTYNSMLSWHCSQLSVSTFLIGYRPAPSLQE